MSEVKRESDRRPRRPFDLPGLWNLFVVLFFVVVLVVVVLEFVIVFGVVVRIVVQAKRREEKRVCFSADRRANQGARRLAG